MSNPPELMGLAAWTELCELHDWDEDDAKDTLDRFVHCKIPIPVGRVRELCQVLASSQALIAAKTALRAEIEC
jgi:hypothetical protein